MKQIFARAVFFFHFVNEEEIFIILIFSSTRCGDSKRKLVGRRARESIMFGLVIEAFMLWPLSRRMMTFI